MFRTTRIRTIFITIAIGAAAAIVALLLLHFRWITAVSAILGEGRDINSISRSVNTNNTGRAVGAPGTEGVTTFTTNDQTSSSRAISDNQIYNQTLMAGSLAIPTSIADTDAEREQGLSDTASLPANSGKLFIFPTPGNYGFWMKDMNYALDFVWISKDMKIVGITPEVGPSTYPNIYYPPSPAQYVLEVNSGFSTRHNLSVGEQLSFKK
ncbi:MAG TPA: DUF192 domain-containing protein [Candidatus Paceibacterota bacterium]|jgi:uncharacterized membrane protein (UPF0127 family)|nr:DUF192 domain-containing protein [Candidatus Paceibacterota bacterium]